jgi:hypothetical protein
MVETEDGESCKMPEASYVLSKKKQKPFCDFISSVKFQDGYASNLARCIAADGCKLMIVISYSKGFCRLVFAV